MLLRGVVMFFVIFCNLTSKGQWGVVSCVV